MCVGTTSSQHYLEHAMSAYHQDLHREAALIMLSKAYILLISLTNKFVMNIGMAKALGGLFLCDRCELSIEDCVAIYEASYK